MRNSSGIHGSHGHPVRRFVEVAHGQDGETARLMGPVLEITWRMDSAMLKTVVSLLQSCTEHYDHPSYLH
jgi:hypothetical protein